MSALTEENIIYFLGILEQKGKYKFFILFKIFLGIDSISDYSKLIGELLKLEHGERNSVDQQKEDLLNIIAYENANVMNYYSRAN